ncbi:MULTISPECIES: type II toxin-antitoxin system PemK/MazF family toxin [Aerococcus]|uniref:type II toxin-antitoxin system PemK/MazF family toxin n=1 Tax=Aerococcus TaxID=1375 RepID=UPI0018A7D230|nr:MULTISPECIES: type II toxin-antitoxin system PemK/MazF family toxin [Aerococcus]MCY3067569.1 type II toxin-antitoxin system PemK/MazF family toxin [Aerococcus mictus]MCY3080896.1 type II toxin-antitoxin system PemK/MazF family toxin [Aerococcus mictus]MDK8485523.1 type II toxin-antitoxin system PemK/MazF family toxin [Aerococcus urinae]
MVKQFDIATIDLDPTRGHEKGKKRPVLIVSNELINNHTSFVWVMPITSRTKKYPMDIEVVTDKNKVYGIIDTVQLRCLDFKSRNGKVIDHLSKELYQDILDTISVHIEN